MGDSFVTIIAIFLVAILMFIFPLMAVADRTDDISQLSVQSSVSDFVDTVRTTGKLGMDEYSKFESELNATGNTYDIELELQILDENIGVKTAQADMTKIGENQYYNKYTTQILDQLGSGTIDLKEGDIFSVTVKNTNTTISQILRNFMYHVTGNTAYSITAQQSGIVTVNGSNT